MADQAQEYVRLIAELEALHDKALATVTAERVKHREKTKSLRAALEFYANPDSYPDERLHRLTAVASAALDPDKESTP